MGLSKLLDFPATEINFSVDLRLVIHQFEPLSHHPKRRHIVQGVFFYRVLNALHILDAIEKIQRIQARGDLTEDEVLYDATLRNLQTLSEATQLLPDDKKDNFPEIPWREISGLRNILVHN